MHMSSHGSSDGKLLTRRKSLAVSRQDRADIVAGRQQHDSRMEAVAGLLGAKSGCVVTSQISRMDDYVTSQLTMSGNGNGSRSLGGARPQRHWQRSVIHLR